MNGNGNGKGRLYPKIQSYPKIEDFRDPKEEYQKIEGQRRDGW